jgi:hypothetical protein
MSINIIDRTIDKIAIIDDQADVRESYEFLVDDLGVQSISETGPLTNLTNCVDLVCNKSDAVICDYRLRVKAYSTFDGAELAAEFYKTNFPAVLCTKWHKAMIDEIRQYRRFIPSLIDPARLDTSTIRSGLESCIREFHGEFMAIRRPWRTLVRVEDIQKNEDANVFIYVVVPAWNSNEVIKLPSGMIPIGICSSLKSGSRLHAKVNLGAAGNEELFFEEWEV